MPLYARTKHRYSAKTTKVFSDKEFPVTLEIFDRYAKEAGKAIDTRQLWDPRRLAEVLRRYELSDDDQKKNTLADKLEKEIGTKAQALRAEAKAQQQQDKRN